MGRQMVTTELDRGSVCQSRSKPVQRTLQGSVCSCLGRAAIRCAHCELFLSTLMKNLECTLLAIACSSRACRHHNSFLLAIACYT